MVSLKRTNHGRFSDAFMHHLSTTGHYGHSEVQRLDQLRNLVVQPLVP